MRFSPAIFAERPLFRLRDLAAHAARIGKTPPHGHERQALCRDGEPALAMPATESDLPAWAAGELEQLRACARYLGIASPNDEGWFGRIVRDRVLRSKGTRPDWDRVYPGLTDDARATRHIAQAGRRAALVAGLWAASAHAGEIAIALTDGLAAPLGIPLALASVACETLYSAIVQIDLACDLASIYGVPFDLRDAGELATVFDLTLSSANAAAHRSKGRPGAAPTLMRILVANDAEILARIGRGFIADATLGLVPLLGIPCSARKGYRATRRLGDSVHDYVRRRKAVRESLGVALRGARLDTTLLLEGAWLLATCDGVATHEELLILSMLARMIPPSQSPPLARLHHVGEGMWIARMALLPDAARGAIVDALHTIAGLRGATRLPERRFLVRIGAALSCRIDFARIEHVRALVARGKVVLPHLRAA